MSPTRSRPLSSAPSVRPPERRLAARIPLELPVRVRDGWLRSEARSVDLSTSGMLVVQDRRRESDADPVHLALDFALPGGGEPIHAIVRPAWSRGPFRAFKFLALSDADRLAIAEHIDRYAP